MNPRTRWAGLLGLLGVSAWLAVFGDKTPSTTSTPMASAAARAPAQAASPALAPVPTAAPARTHATSAAPTQPPLPRLIARDVLIPVPATPSEAPTHRTANVAPQRDLFASRNWTPPSPPPPPQPVAAPVAPPLPYTFLGKKLEGGAWEVYLGRGEQTFIAREGVTLDGHYHVDRIAPPALTLTYIPLGQAQTLSIGDSR